MVLLTAIWLQHFNDKRVVVMYDTYIYGIHKDIRQQLFTSVKSERQYNLAVTVALIRI